MTVENIPPNPSLRFKEINEKNFPDLFSLFRPKLERYFIVRTGWNPMVSEDLTQDTFMKVWNARTSYRGETLQAWIFKIAHNALVDSARRPEGFSNVKFLEEEKAEPFDDSDVPFRSAELRSDLFSGLKECLPLLSDLQREVFYLRFIEELSLEEVSVITSYKINYIKMLQHYGLKVVRKYLEDRGLLSN